MEIFLMHMWFMAPVRSVLIRVGVANFYINFALNFMVSMYAPVFAMKIVDRIGIKDALIRPTRFVRNLRKR